MQYEDLEKLAIAGKLQITKTIYRNRIRRRYIWDKEYEHIIETKKIPYRVFSYNARTEDMPENSFYKITKRDYEALLKLCSSSLILGNDEMERNSKNNA